jgi:hypothetical protein
MLNPPTGRPVVRITLKEGETFYLLGTPIKLSTVDRGRVVLTVPLAQGWRLDTQKLAIVSR